MHQILMFTVAGKMIDTLINIYLKFQQFAFHKIAYTTFNVFIEIFNLLSKNLRLTIRQRKVYSNYETMSKQVSMHRSGKPTYLHFE